MGFTDFLFFYRMNTSLAAIVIILFSLSFVPNISGQDGFSKILNSQTTLPDRTVYSEITYIQDFSSGAEIKDLTDDVHRICNRSKNIKAGNNNITVHFSDVDIAVIDLISENLSKVLQETQKNLAPLVIDDLEIYLLPIDSIKFNFKLAVKSKDKVFHFLKPYKKIKDLNLDCSNGYSFGNNIFLDIPHELTHNALKDFIDQTIENTSNYPRWFEEGLAEFNSIKVAEKLYPCWAEYTISFTIPDISLTRKEVYSNLFKWGRDNKVILDWLKPNPSSEKIIWNEMTFFGASYQLLSNDFGSQNGKLERFLSILQNYKKYPTKIRNTDLIKIYKNFIGREFGKKNNLSYLKEKQIIQIQSDFIIQDFQSNLPEENKIKRYKALSIIASSDFILGSETIKALIGIKKKLESDSNKDSLNTTYIALIDTAIAVRLSNKLFSKNLFTIVDSENKFNINYKVKNKNDFIDNSFRPVN